MRVLFVGDIVGRHGRRALAHWCGRLRTRMEADVVVANVENAAGGNGITPTVVDEIAGAGVDLMTTGNHVWDKRDGLSTIEQGHVIRPANYPPEVPGVGSATFSLPSGESLGVVNVQGRVFMTPLDCPFKATRREINRLRSETNAILVDFHAEATAEKQALAWYFDGQVSAVVGTHTHVPTCDERVLSGGTAYISDVGMTGAYDTVIGMKPEPFVQRMITGMPTRNEPGKGDVRLCAVLIDIDADTGDAAHIERIMVPYPEKEEP